MEKVKTISISLMLMVCLCLLFIAPSSLIRADHINELYEVRTPGYKSVNRNYLPPLGSISEARYVLQDGIYVNPKASDSGKAVINIVGDLMCHTDQQKVAKKNNTFNFNENFYFVKDIFKKSDFVIGNLETMLSQTAPYRYERPTIDNKPHLNAPATYLDALKFAGVDCFAMANNHNVDTGYQGMVETNGHIDRYDFMRTGLFTNSEESRYIIAEVNGIKIAIFSYATYYNTKDRFLTKQGIDVLLNYYSKEKAETEIAEAKAKGAEFVLVNIHWGTEYVNYENDLQRRYAKELADAGADYIAGSHPHAVQPYDIIVAEDGRSVPVIYSLGNFISSMSREVCLDNFIVKLTLERLPDGEISITDGYIPCHIMDKYQNKRYATVPQAAGTANAIRIAKILGDKFAAISDF